MLQAIQNVAAKPAALRDVMTASPYPPQDDTMDHVIKFLGKREGIDKTLKIIRYTSRLLAAVTPADAELHKKAVALDSSVGVSRKAFRLGKFLQDLNNIRKSKTTGSLYLLELVANGGEGLYYFLEQFAWLMKTGALSRANEKQLAKYSAWAELIGYIANIWLSFIKLHALIQEQVHLQHRLYQLRKEEDVTDTKVEGQLSALRYAINLRKAVILQDLADSAIAINDVQGGHNAFLSHPVTLALAGLISAFVSAHKNWYA